MAGSPRTIAFNGVRFGISADVEPKVHTGGRIVTEVEEYGDGQHVPLFVETAGKITDLEIRLCEDLDDFQRFDALAKQKNLAIVYEGSEGTYTGTGVIVAGTEGLLKNTNKDKSEPFSVVATRGQFTKI